MIISRITMYETARGFRAKIEHDGKTVTGEHPYNAIQAYRNAEIQLVISPGYIMGADPADGEPCHA